MRRFEELSGLEVLKGQGRLLIGAKPLAIHHSVIEGVERFSGPNERSYAVPPNPRGFAYRPLDTDFSEIHLLTLLP